MTAALALAVVAVFVVSTVDSWVNPPRVYVPTARHHDPAGWSVTVPLFPAWLYDPVDRTAGTTLNTGEWCAIGAQPKPVRFPGLPFDIVPPPPVSVLSLMDWPEPPALPPTMPHDWPGLHVNTIDRGEMAS